MAKSSWLLIGGLAVAGIVGAMLFIPGVTQAVVTPFVRPFIDETGSNLSPLGLEVLNRYQQITGGQQPQGGGQAFNMGGYHSITVA